jgi:hypothetical protein
MTTQWYNATKKDSLQGLVYDEVTGENIAVTFNPEDGQLVSAAPDLLIACELALALIRGEIYNVIDPENTIVAPALRKAIEKATQ